MYELIKLFFDICSFRKGPQDIPSSRWLLRLLVLAYIGINYLILLFSSDLVQAFLQVLVEVVLVLVLTWGLLSFIGKPERYTQTACALLGTDAMISLLASPAIATLIGQGSAGAFLVVVGMILWHWAVTGHIFKHALSQPLIFALGVAFLYILASYQVMAFLFPELTETSG